MKLTHSRITKFQKTILSFSAKEGRTFSWRSTRDPYAILVSEIMLQQTQVGRVVPKYMEWMKKFPNPESLATAKIGEVLRLWQGLGYNRRALNLKRTAEMIVKEYNGVFPKTVKDIDVLPGVGPYTAGAVGAFAFGIPSAFIETNIRTVYLHFFFKKKKKVRDEEILKLVEQTLPKHPLASKTRHSPSKEGERIGVREGYSALMDYGAMLKKTEGNMNVRSAHYMKQAIFEGSRRQVRGAILRLASKKGAVKVDDFRQYVSAHSVMDIISELAKEGFLKKEGKTFRLA